MTQPEITEKTVNEEAVKPEEFSIYSLNPNAADIDGVACFPTLVALPKVPDVLITVVPPAATEQLVKEAKQLGIKRVWMQSGSESAEAISYCEKNGIAVVAKACFIVDGLKKSL